MKKIITLEELDFIEDYIDRIRKPAVFLSDFKNKRYWKNRWYQNNMLLDKSLRVACSSARGVGKSESIRQDIINEMLDPANFFKEGLLAAPGRVHLDSIWDKIVLVFENDPFLSTLVKQSTRTPTYRLRLSNGYILNGRITTASKGKSLFGLHVDHVWIDEAELFMRRETDELEGCLNEGASLKLYGIPNGIMTSYLYRAYRGDVSGQFGTKNNGKYNIDKFQDPTFTEEEHQKKIKIYGGKHTQLYINQVLAKEGQASHLTFPARYWMTCQFDMPTYDFLGLNEDDVDMIIKNGIDTVPLVAPPIGSEKIRLAIDFGYSPDPTVILFFNEQNQMFFRVQMDGVAYHKQAKLVHYIAEYYQAERITGDNGEAGKTVWQQLRDNEMHDGLYANRCYEMIAVDFQGTVKIGVRTEVKNGKQKQVDIMERIKQYSTVLLQKAFENKGITIPEQALAVIEEIQTSTRHKSIHGNWLFGGIDHHLSCLRSHVISDLLVKVEVQDEDTGSAWCLMEI